MSFFISIALATCVFDDEQISADELVTLLRGMHSRLQDVSFVYEGDLRYVANGEDSEEKEAFFNCEYQGVYAYRSDGDTFLDRYHRRLADPTTFSREVLILRMPEHSLEQVGYAPDLGKLSLQPQKRRAAPGFLNMEYNPERFFLLPDMMYELEHRVGYECIGWTSLDDHRCLRIRLDRSLTNEPARKFHADYWIDLDRGGWPLRVEVTRFGGMSLRIDVQLETVAEVDGTPFWFPTSARVESFLKGTRVRRDPVAVETMYVVRGSLRWNQGLSDSVFTFDNVHGLPDTDSFRQFREEFARTRPVREPEPATDPASVEQNLERMLVEAESQSRALDASRSASPLSWTLGVGRYILIALGAVLLVGAWVLRGRIV